MTLPAQNKNLKMDCVFDMAKDRILTVLDAFDIEYSVENRERKYICDSIDSYDITINKIDLINAFKSTINDSFKTKIFAPILEYLKINDFIQSNKE